MLSGTQTRLKQISATKGLIGLMSDYGDDDDDDNSSAACTSADQSATSAGSTTCSQDSIIDAVVANAGACGSTYSVKVGPVDANAEAALETFFSDIVDIAVASKADDDEAAEENNVAACAASVPAKQRPACASDSTVAVDGDIVEVEEKEDKLDEGSRVNDFLSGVDIPLTAEVSAGPETDTDIKPKISCDSTRGFKRRRVQEPKISTREVSPPVQVESAAIDILIDKIQKGLHRIGISTHNVAGMTAWHLAEVQMRTRLEDYQAGKLPEQYILEKMTELEKAFSDYERSLAPAGWQVSYDWTQMTYLYTNEETGRTSFEYPTGNLRAKSNEAWLTGQPPPPSEPPPSESDTAAPPPPAGLPPDLAAAATSSRSKKREMAAGVGKKERKDKPAGKQKVANAQLERWNKARDDLQGPTISAKEKEALEDAAIEKWKSKQVEAAQRSGSSSDNPNFIEVSGDWRAKREALLKERLAKAANNSLSTSNDK